MLNFDKSYPWNSILLLSVFSDVKVYTAVKKRERIKFKISFFLYFKKVTLHVYERYIQFIILTDILYLLFYSN